VINIFRIIFLLIFTKAGAQSSSLTVADSLYAIGNYTLAINEYAKVASPNAQLQIARAYNAIGNYEKALAQYENIVQKTNSKNWQHMNLEGCI
jgi:tetratricopeptide (TPR) repeat protein